MTQLLLRPKSATIEFKAFAGLAVLSRIGGQRRSHGVSRSAMSMRIVRRICLARVLHMFTQAHANCLLRRQEVLMEMAVGHAILAVPAMNFLLAAMSFLLNTQNLSKKNACMRSLS